MVSHSGPNRIGMERYKVTLAYDGTHFFGFQRQGKDRTVQLEVEAALRRLRWQGRTMRNFAASANPCISAGCAEPREG